MSVTMGKACVPGYALMIKVRCEATTRAKKPAWYFKKRLGREGEMKGEDQWCGTYNLRCTRSFRTLSKD